MMRYKDSDATVVKNRADANVEEVVELIKGALYMDLRQRFDVSEVKQLYEKIDNAVRLGVAE